MPSSSSSNSGSTSGAPATAAYLQSVGNAFKMVSHRRRWSDTAATRSIQDQGLQSHPDGGVGVGGGPYENVFTTESITMYRAGSGHHGLGGAGSDDVVDSAEDDGNDEDDCDTDVEDDEMSCTEDQRSPPPPVAW